MSDDRDRFLLNKGHGAPALFQFFLKEISSQTHLLKSLVKMVVYYEHPPKPGLIRGVEAATGSVHGYQWH